MKLFLRAVALNAAVAALALACSGLAVVKEGRVALGANADQPFVDDLSLRATPGRDGLWRIGVNGVRTEDGQISARRERTLLAIFSRDW
jgi:hypothetical protein